MAIRNSTVIDPSIPTLKPRVATRFLPEQQAVIDSTSKIVKVRAGAGTGKTSTLVGYADARPDQRVLYLAFNRAIREEAQSRFGPNVQCKTVHSIAYNAVGRQYADKMELGGLRPSDVARFLGIGIMQAFSGIEVLKNFLYSSDNELNLNNAITAKVPPKNYTVALDCAKVIWASMVDRKGVIPMIHDGYLKLFHLQNHEISPKFFDIVMLDEAQDTNPVTAAIVSKFTGTKVYVGDQNQSIYEFRGASDAMDGLAGQEYAIRTSFRFGQPVADVANLILKHTIMDEMRLTGAGKSVGVDVSRPPNDQYAVIARTNGYLIGEALDALNEGRSYHVIGTPDISLKLPIFMDAFRLQEGLIEEIKTPFIKQFGDFDSLALAALETNDVELNSLVNTVVKYGDRLPNVIHKVRTGNATEQANADTVLVTAHKAKGLEFDHVSLGEDYVKVVESDLPENGVERQEGNLLYVAVTRAKKTLLLNTDLRAFVKNPVDNILADTWRKTSTYGKLANKTSHPR